VIKFVHCLVHGVLSGVILRKDLQGCSIPVAILGLVPYS